jgi:alkyl hydroperoxide reductase subunit AhpC
MVPDTIEHLETWKKEIANLATRPITIPIIEDTSKKLAQLYDMYDILSFLISGC